MWCVCVCVYTLNIAVSFLYKVNNFLIIEIFSDIINIMFVLML